MGKYHDENWVKYNKIVKNGVVLDNLLPTIRKALGKLDIFAEQPMPAQWMALMTSVTFVQHIEKHQTKTLHYKGKPHFSELAKEGFTPFKLTVTENDIQQVATTLANIYDQAEREYRHYKINQAAMIKADVAAKFPMPEAALKSVRSGVVKEANQRPSLVNQHRLFQTAHAPTTKPSTYGVNMART